MELINENYISGIDPEDLVAATAIRSVLALLDPFSQYMEKIYKERKNKIEWGVAQRNRTSRYG